MLRAMDRSFLLTPSASERETRTSWGFPVASTVNDTTTVPPSSCETVIGEGNRRGAMTDFIIETSQLCKSFKDKPALRGLDLRVPAGSIFGFLGRNGAGKTTTIKNLMGLLRADSGGAHVFGNPVADADRSVEVRRRIGFVTEDKELYPYMTVEQIIRFARPFFPKWRDDLEQRYLQMFELPPKRKIPDLSKGMRSKLMLLLAMSRGADLLILDEPTDGLDPPPSKTCCASWSLSPPRREQPCSFHRINWRRSI
jgi:ABC-type branched-subunit amino acid transport system ATPase component